MHSSTMSDVIAFPPNHSDGMDPLMGEARERQQRRRQRMAGAVVIAVVVAGTLILTGREWGFPLASNGRQHAVTTTVDAAPPVAPSEWKAVIRDWYADGVFNSPHRCAAVRAAITILPDSLIYSKILKDTRSLEHRTCR